MKIAAIIVCVALTGPAIASASGEADLPFRVGEKLTYQIFWGPFVVGRATLEVRGVEPVDGHDCYHLVARARTTGLTDWMFPIDSTSESWLDVQGLFSRKYRQNRLEGDHKRNDETVFDYEHGEAITTNAVSGKTKRNPVDGPVQDVVSCVYYMRAQPLMLDAEQQFVMNANSTNYTVNVCPDQRKRLFVRPVGDVQALRLEPHPTLKIVASNKGRMWLWVSDDKRRLPLLVNSNMRVGSARLVLSKIEAIAPAVASRPEKPDADHPESSVAAKR